MLRAGWSGRAGSAITQRRPAHRRPGRQRASCRPDSTSSHGTGPSPRPRRSRHCPTTRCSGSASSAPSERSRRSIEFADAQAPAAHVRNASSGGVGTADRTRGPRRAALLRDPIGAHRRRVGQPARRRRRWCRGRSRTTVIPPAPSRSAFAPRPFLGRHFAGGSSSPVESSAGGSATRRSVPASTSNTHSAFTGSLPPALRRNTTRLPSGDTVTLRGSPSVKRCVLAC